MKTVEIVKTEKGIYVTRRYCNQNKGREFFFTIVPHPMKKKSEEKAFLKEQAEAKEKYIKDWVGK